MESHSVIALQLLLGHLLTDFVFQNKQMIAHKRKYKAKSYQLYIHALLAGLLSYLFVMRWNAWYIIPIIATTHFAIDLWKLHQKEDNLKNFLVDQLLHLIVLTFLWIQLINGFGDIQYFIVSIVAQPAVLTVLIAYILVIFPIGFIVGKATERWNRELITEFKDQSLANAGRYIGIFERILTLTFIFTANYAAIGFLIGAKSILRFGDSKGTRKQTEYVLIGTLMSFSLCIGIGVFMRALLAHFA